MSGEPDCTGSGGSGFILEPPLSSIINSSKNNNKINNNNNEDTDCDLEKVICASSNNLNAATTTSTTAASTQLTKNFLNDATNLEQKILLKCERCDNFETISHALLLLHTAQCRGDGNASGSSSSRQIAMDSGAGDSGTETDMVQSTLDVSGIAATAAATSSSNNNNNNNCSMNNNNNSITNNNSNSSNGKQNADQQHQRKLFECDVCNMKFSNGANMRRHKMRHTGVKPYECRVCQKRFFRKDHLAEHFTTHTKTLPYHCPICNRGFQRQIAMRAHFQNEHVGQHDLVKTCPLCSYRAGTMKSLRIHFFNRHGIDLDNPGPNAPSSLLLALDPTNAGNYLPSIALAAAAAAANASNNMNMNANSNSGPTYSDSGDSLRSADNATPPMHFLTPHVEISMADNDSFKVNHMIHRSSPFHKYFTLFSFPFNQTEPMPTSVSSALEIQPCGSVMSNCRPVNGGSPSPHSADSNSNAPSSSQSIIGSVLQNSRHLLLDGQITPSISLIPIKQVSFQFILQVNVSFILLNKIIFIY